MAVKNRGLSREESLALETVRMTATGVEVLISNAELYLYTVVANGDYLARLPTRISVLDGTSATGGVAGVNTFGISMPSASAVGPPTQQLNFNPPLHFKNGLVVSAYGFGETSTVMFGYKA